MPRVLIIDDEEWVRQFIAELLTDAGYEVLTASSGVEGIRQFERCPVDLVVTDLIMPDKEGIETICELRATRPDLPIIAVSGGSPKGLGSYLGSALALGADCAFQKPFEDEELLAAVARLIREGRSGGS